LFAPKTRRKRVLAPALVNSVVTEPSSALLNYTVVSNSNAGLVTPTINGSGLTLSYTPGQTGSAVIKLQATDASGRSVTTSFTVTVS
jgi:hypothetical protein